jgi:hypothetical protein
MPDRAGYDEESHLCSATGFAAFISARTKSNIRTGSTTSQMRKLKNDLSNLPPLHPRVDPDPRRSAPGRPGRPQRWRWLVKSSHALQARVPLGKATVTHPQLHQVLRPTAPQQLHFKEPVRST